MKENKVLQNTIRYLLAPIAIASMTAIIFITHANTNMVNVDMLYLLAVQAVTFWLGSRPAVLASFVAFLTCDFFFVEPIYQLTVRDPFEFVALCVFLVTAITTGQLTARFHSQAEEARRREIAASALAQASWTIASEPETTIALTSVLRHLKKIAVFKQAAILDCDDENKPVIATCVANQQTTDLSCISRQVIDHVLLNPKAPALDLSLGEKVTGLPSQYLPVFVDEHCAAILFVEFGTRSSLSEIDRQILESIANHIAVVLQRDRLMQEQARTHALSETNKLKTALLQMVSHDFRSPLASIKASVSSLYDESAERPLDEETKIDLLETIDSQADRLNKMVGNILDLSRLETGNWAPKREATEVSELIGATLDSFNEEQNKRIKVTLDSPLLEFSLDLVQIVQALKNLIENALKYSAKETIVELEAKDDHGDLVIRVLDRGKGLPKGEEERIFDPFYRAPADRETPTPGIGMGLAISRGLVEAHGAKLSARNREGGGSIFEARFPGSIKQKQLSSENEVGPENLSH